MRWRQSKQAFSERNNGKCLEVTPVESATTWVEITAGTGGSTPIVQGSGDSEAAANIWVRGQGTGQVTLGQSSDAGIVLACGTQQFMNASEEVMLKLGEASAAVNYLRVDNAATGSSPAIVAAGTDDNINITLTPKGTGSVIFDGDIGFGDDITDENGNEIVGLDATGSAINEVRVSNAAIGNAPALTAGGDDTNIGITLAGKGTGSVNLGQATSTGVKLVADQPVLDSAGNELVKFVKTTTAVNELTVTNAATGNGPTLTATGETNVPITLAGKGTGSVLLGQATSTGVQLVANQPLLDSAGLELVKFTATASAINEITVANAAISNGPSISATGDDTNIPVTLAGKGTGKVSLGQATSIGVGLAADQAILDSSDNELVKFTKTATAVNELTIANAATGNGPSITASGETNVPITLAAKGTGKVVLGQATSDGVQLVADQPILDSAGLELISFTKTATAVNQVDITNAATGNGPTVAAKGETNVPITLSGAGTGKVFLGQATSEGIQLVANQPILDSAGLELVKFTATGSAINEITVASAAIGNGPSISATGDDANISVTLAGKGTGSVILGQATSTGVQLAADQAILDSAGLELVKFSKTATAVNEVTIANAATGNGPSFTASGEADVPITLAAKGTGKVFLGQATSGGIQLVGDQPILDSSGNELLAFVKTADALNEVTVAAGATGANATLTATGETNAGISLVSKGTGFLKFVAVDADAIAVQKDTATKIGFFAQTPATKPLANTAALTTVTPSGAPGTPDYAWAAPVQNTGFGWSTSDEMLTAVAVIVNLQTRVSELETKLQALGLLTA